MALPVPLAWTMAEHVTARTGAHGVDWPQAMAAQTAVRRLHTARVLRTARSWGDLWHLDVPARDARNAYLRGRDARDYTYVDWLYGPTALVPEELAPPFPPAGLRW